MSVSFVCPERFIRETDRAPSWTGSARSGGKREEFFPAVFPHYSGIDGTHKVSQYLLIYSCYTYFVFPLAFKVLNSRTRLKMSELPIKTLEYSGGSAACRLALVGEVVANTSRGVDDILGGWQGLLLRRDAEHFH